MDNAKDARTVMRRVQEHLRNAHLNLGAEEETVGFVEVVHHTHTPLPTLNYVMPRRNTAHVPASHVEDALRRLQSYGRLARACFADGLYPPMFVGALRDLGLSVEFEMPIMVYRPENGALRQPTLPPEISLVRVSDHQSLGIWWYAWRNAYYDVITTGIEPLTIGRDMRLLTLGHQLDLIMYRYGFPVGVARITLHEKSAHLAARAILRDVHTPELARLLTSAAVKAALSAGCDLIFTDGYTDTERQQCRDMGFTDSGSVVCYAESAQPVPLTELGQGRLAQPVLIV
jgi:hypothetical protein